MDYLVPTLIPGALAVDDRGQVAFVNEFNPADAGVKRTYLTSNHRAGLVRAWHGHHRERKWVMAVSGSALVCTVVIDPIPGLEEEVERFVLSASKPAILAIPPGYANGCMSLTEDARLLWFSSATVEESRVDDVRFEARRWNPWAVEDR
jgi:dTDP-4-dehydrorhamnose 3,5-epimerase